MRSSSLWCAHGANCPGETSRTYQNVAYWREYLRDFARAWDLGMVFMVIAPNNKFNNVVVLALVAGPIGLIIAHHSALVGALSWAFLVIV